MNNTIKEGIRKTADVFSYGMSATIQTCISLLRITVLSSISAARKSKRFKELKNGNKCIVLGNGPSLKKVLENEEIKVGDADMFCVNMFCSSDYFKKLKPNFYLLCDGEYFNPSIERTRNQVKELISSFNAVDWELYIVIPSYINNNCQLITSINNPRVRFLRINCTEVDGFKFFRHFFYKQQIGMPRCQTVINFALMFGINMGFETVLLYGADHSWTKDMWVGDDNKLYTGDPHIYKNKTELITLNHDIAAECLDLWRVFETHKKIREFADSMKVNIVNKTIGSFIDAYNRK